MNDNTDNHTKYNLKDYTEFDDMNLKFELLRGIYSIGFEKPSTIQKIAIMPVIEGHDLIAQAQSGTGKTGTFVIGTLQQIDEDTHECQAIVVSPTRELAQQSINVYRQLSEYMKVNVVSCIGGTNIHESKKKLEGSASIAVGTPGRIVDMLKRGFLTTTYIKVLILDEADELLQNNFQEQIKNIVMVINKSTQICLFSATMPPEIIEITNLFMREPISILMKKEELTLAGIKQYHVDVQHNRYKFVTICNLYKWISVNQSMVYTNTINRAIELRDLLQENNFTVSLIHSKMDMTDRIKIMQDFRAGKSRVLISTDLLSRGIDVHQVALVVNYDLPKNKQCYLHRIGRSGRYGKRGVSVSFVTQRDHYILKDLERHYKTKIDPMPNPETIVF